MDVCGLCSFITRLGILYVCSCDKENSIPGAFEETIPSYPACEHFKRKGESNEKGSC